jgi:hypothetical protein
MIGWIKLHRKITDCELWIDEEPFDRRSAWIDLLILANHEDKKVVFNGNAVVVKAGQRITSIRKLAERWRWGREKTTKFLNLLEALGMLTKESDNHRTLLTIVNYGVYQDTPTTDRATNRPQTEPQTDHTPYHRPDTNKNIKNDKEYKKKRNKYIYGEFQHVKLTEEEKGKLETELGEQMTQDCIQYLDEYIEMKGYKAQSHYLCIKKWVVDAVKRDRQKKEPTRNKVADQLQESYDMIARWAEGRTDETE